METKTDIKVGTVFSTLFDTNCVASSDSDEKGNFTAYDSEDVECLFNVVMVEKVKNP